MRKRLIAGIGVGAALLALTACRSSPDAAAYVGDRTITEQQVTDLMDGYNAVAPADRQVTRPVVVQYLISEELCQRLSRDKQFTFEAAPLQADVPEFVNVANRLESCLEAVPTPGEPTEAQLRGLYQRLVDSGRMPPGTTFAQARAQLEGDPNVQRLLGQQKAITDAAGAAEVSVSPRYRGLRIPVLNEQLADGLGEAGSDAVLDRPSQ